MIDVARQHEAVEAFALEVMEFREDVHRSRLALASSRALLASTAALMLDPVCNCLSDPDGARPSRGHDPALDGHRPIDDMRRHLLVPKSDPKLPTAAQPASDQ